MNVANHIHTPASQPYAKDVPDSDRPPDDPVTVKQIRAPAERPSEEPRRDISTIPDWLLGGG